ncbi:SPOR domain-containing protein [Novosphingobium sp.]|uniref:SPOR domain-containing protein n=1 Tax=Novosphingobium sp. TaxID=1874826 RepID=UPI003340440A
MLTAGDRDKIPGEWRNLVRKARTLKGHKPYLTPWRSNFRLLTGPFDSDADAQDFIAELRKDGVAGFEWTSPAGQAVDTMALP